LPYMDMCVLSVISRSIFSAELQEMNVNLKQVNKKLNEQLDLASVGSADFDDSRRNVMSQSQKIIEEMQ